MNTFFTQTSTLFKSFLLTLFIIVVSINWSYSQVLWSAATGQAWLTGGNWTGGSTPSSTDIAQFGTNPTSALVGVGINMNGSTNNGSNNQAVGTIEITSSRTNNFLVGNSSTSANGTLTLNGTSGNTIINNNGGGTFTLQNIQGSGTRTMNIALGNSTENIITGSGNTTISSVIIGGNPLTKAGSGNLTLSATNTYTGKTKITGGFIVSTGESAFGTNPGTFTSDQITLDGGGISAASGNISFSSNRGITLGGSGGTFNVAASRTITLTNVVTGSGALTKTNSGTLTAAGIHTYTGATNINAGTLQLSTGNNRLPTGTAVVLANAASTSLSLVTFNQTIGSLSGGGSSGGNVSLGSGTLTVGDGNSTAYDGVISGTGGLVKQGSGTLTLSRSNTYSGNTTINAGTLEIGANNILPTVPFILAGGTLSTGSGAGFSETVGTLQLTSNSTIELGSGVHTLTFANSSSTPWTAGQTLTITGWTGSAGKIMVGAGGLSTAQLAQVSFTGYAGTGAISNGELVPASSLPIKLISFSATRQNNQTQLTFSTATEENNNFFAIERSGNGTDFRTIGKVNGAGTTTSIQNYTFTDETPLSGINYYRLKQVDFDGQFTYSPVVNVVFDNKAGIRLAPTPVQDQLRVELDEMFQDDAQWQLYDFAGRLVQTGVLSAENTVFNVEVGSLTPGNYVIRVVSGQTTLTKQFQK